MAITNDGLFVCDFCRDDTGKFDNETGNHVPCQKLHVIQEGLKMEIGVNMFADAVVSRCKNPLETQSDVASVFAYMLAEMDKTPQEKIDAAIQAVKTRWPSKTGFLTVKKMAWRIYETRQRAQHRLQSDKSRADTAPEVCEHGFASSCPENCN